MAFNPANLATNPIDRIRFEVGDTSQYPIFADAVYEYLYYKNDENENIASIEALEQIINTLIISPGEMKVGDVTEVSGMVEFFEGRLLALRQKQYIKVGTLAVAPLAIRGDRKNWDDIDGIFKRSID